MPQIAITAPARQGMERCRAFLALKNPQASRHAAQAIGKAFTNLAANPEMGRKFDLDGSMRELLIQFGNSGYIALYEIDETADTIIILTFRHQKEAGY